jgi:cytokinesis protein
MMKIDRFKERIDHMLFKVEFNEKLRHLSENMNAVLDASNAVKESKALKELLNVCIFEALSDVFQCPLLTLHFSSF